MSDNSSSQPTPAAAEAIARLGQLVLGSRPLGDVLDIVVDIAKAALPGPPEVSITLVGGKATTAASSGRVSLDLDERQYAVGYGPCLDAIRLGQIVIVWDTSSEDRWPEYIPRAREAGVLASVSVPLPVEDQHIGAMNIYSDQPGILDDEAVETARTVAAFAAVALANADRYEKSEALAQQLAEALQSRAVIDQAKGILMGEHHISADDAFDMLIKSSQNGNRKLREVAVDLVERTQRSG